MTGRPAIEAALFEQMVADLRAKLDAHGAAIGGLWSIVQARQHSKAAALAQAAAMAACRPWAASPCAMRGLLSMRPACPRAPSLGVPGLGRVGRGKREKAGPGGPSMNSKGAEISHFGETWGGFRERKTRGAGATADCLSVRNQWVVYPKFIFGESGESREGG